MSRKLTMLSGLPASGKSTLAKAIVEKDGNTGRINRDDIRDMVYNGKWSGPREKIVVEIEQAIAEVLLKNNQHVVVDDTNLGPKHESLWKTFSDTSGAAYIKHPVNTDLNTCLNRDLLRKNSVGHNVILKMAARYGFLDWPDKDIVLVDIDGTLADGTHRERFLKQEPKDWNSYFNLQEQDLPIRHIFKWVAELGKDHTIVVVSGRGAEREMSTRAWFNKIWMPNYLFPELDVPRFTPFVMFFRDKGDHRPDNLVKREMLKLLPRKPVLVIDDRPVVIRMWREEGLRVIPVKGDCAEF